MHFAMRDGIKIIEQNYPRIILRKIQDKKIVNIFEIFNGFK